MFCEKLICDVGMKTSPALPNAESKAPDAVKWVITTDALNELLSLRSGRIQQQGKIRPAAAAPASVRAFRRVEK